MREREGKKRRKESKRGGEKESVSEHRRKGKKMKCASQPRYGKWGFSARSFFCINFYTRLCRCAALGGV